MTFLWTDRTVRQALDLGLGEEPPRVEFGRVSTDSRDVKSGDLFVALQGERFDGHDFVADALDQGAAGVVVKREFHGPPPEGASTPRYDVPDTLEALGHLAHFRRRALEARVVGITGSSGKTGTKNLLTEVARGTFPIHATQGNLNNRIGLPLTLLSAPDEARVVILEMGTNEPGEIRILTEIAEPELGVITTVSETHLEKLRSLDGVMEEKLDLFRGLPTHGLGVVGDEPPLLEERARGVAPTLLVTGLSDRAAPEHRPEALTPAGNGTFRFRWRGEEVRLQVPGRHSVRNALLALAVSDVLGVPPRDAARRIGDVRATGMRSEIRRIGDLTLVVDCYNSNPQSLSAALDLLAAVDGDGARVAVLGSMLELGPGALEIHRRSLQEALDSNLDLIVATGLFADVAGDVERTRGGTAILTAGTLEEAREILMDSLEASAVVLLKASRGVAMEALIPALEHRFGPGREA